jgi:hypothetical protein
MAITPHKKGISALVLRKLKDLGAQGATSRELAEDPEVFGASIQHWTKYDPSRWASQAAYIAYSLSGVLRSLHAHCRVVRSGIKLRDSPKISYYRYYYAEPVRPLIELADVGSSYKRDPEIPLNPEGNTLDMKVGLIRIQQIGFDTVITTPELTIKITQNYVSKVAAEPI